MIKKAAAVIMLAMVASLCMAGCTTTVSNTTTSPSPTSADMTAKLNNAFTAQNFTIITPFSRATNQYGNVVYTGVVRDGEKTLVPYTHNFTIEETKSRNDSLTRFSAYVAQALRQRYPHSTNTTGIFYGAIGNDVNPGKSVGMSINEPDRGLTWPYHLGGMGVNGASNPNYTVVVDYMTKA